MYIINMFICNCIVVYIYTLTLGMPLISSTHELWCMVLPRLRTSARAIESTSLASSLASDLPIARAWHEPAHCLQMGLQIHVAR